MENGAQIQKPDFFSFMVKADRVAAWVLLVVVVLYAISGYGMTKGLIDRSLAVQLHLSWLGAFGIVAFVLHSSWAIHLAFKRWQVWNVFSKACLIVLYIGFVAGFGYIHFFYEVAARDAVVLNSTSPISAVQPSSAETIQPVFTVAELAKFDGKNGKPAYVAVDGIVYDLSSVFINGTHQGHAAGQDLSAAFASVHAKQALSNYKQVGIY